MRAIRIEAVRAGDILGKSLFNERSELMLAAGYELTEEIISLLKRRGYRQIYIKDDSVPDFKPLEVVSDTVRNAVTERLNNAFGLVEEELSRLPASPIQMKKRLEEDPSFRGMVPMNEVGESVSNLLDEILENNISILGAIPVKSEVGRFYQHALDTALTAVLIGQFFKYEYKELKTLGTAALMHDIGKLALGELYAKKRSEYTRQERWLMNEHPTYSMLILKGSDPHSYIEQSAVLQHHERPDGKGFPQGMRGLNVAPLKARAVEPGFILRHAEILTVANVYDNLISGVEDGEAHSPQSAISRMVPQAGARFNPHVLRALSKVVQFYPVGSVVRILNTYSGKWVGFKGVVKKANPVEYAKPVLLLTHDDLDSPIDHEEVDLSQERVVYLELEFGY